MKNKYSKLALVTLILLNLLLTYVLFWNPYSLYFDRPELSELTYTTRSTLTWIASIITFILIWWTGINALRIWKKEKRLTFVALVISVLTFIGLMHIQKYYPDGQSEFTQDGYQFKIQKWHLDGEEKYKRWKSKQPLNAYKDYKEIVWVLDSISDK